VSMTRKYLLISLRYYLFVSAFSFVFSPFFQNTHLFFTDLIRKEIP
jgi:hypothetical protein